VLSRQKVVLALLEQLGRPLSPTVFVKLVFLLRHETKLAADRAFYDFVPYKYGPFSFTLYWELACLKRAGYVTAGKEQVAHCLALATPKAREIPEEVRESVACIVKRYGRLDQKSLVAAVYKRYPWYATMSQMTQGGPAPSHPKPVAKLAVYTVGYGGKSVDAFLNELLRFGIQVVVDVRANPVSRTYGFSRKVLGEIAPKVGLEYRHVPSLGIPSKQRANLTSFDSYQSLLDQYESQTLPSEAETIREIAQLMLEKPAILVCVEKDERCCHRSRLALSVSRISGLDVVNL